MAVLLVLLFAARSSVAATCPPDGYTRDSLFELKANGFELPDARTRSELAVSLTGCTGDPDPGIRDGIAYEALAGWMRAGSLAPATVDVIGTALLSQLAAADDPEGFRKPFAALLLSEVARTDRIEPAFTPARREELVRAAANYLQGIRDYRGFSETEGWRHGVAHGADLALQLVLNPNIGATQVQLLLDAVFSQVAPPGEHFYIYGEPARLARPVYSAYRRGDIGAEAWQAWFGRLTDPAPLARWSESWSSQAGLAKRHNTTAFLRALYVAASTAEDAATAGLAQLVLGALSRTQE